jgi:hypothetical protein
MDTKRTELNKAFAYANGNGAGDSAANTLKSQINSKVTSANTYFNRL